MRTLNRREFVKLASLGLGAAAGMTGRDAFAEEKGKQPNIVFVFADQMRAHAMGCMGDTVVKTPNLDALAAKGLLLTNALSCSPVCSPYRAQLMTGRYGHATGVVHNDIKLPNSEISIAKVLKGRGYATGYIGKWHLSGHRRDPVPKADRHGWDFWAVRNCSHKHFEPAYWLNDSKTPVKVKGWEPDVQTDLAVEYIKKNRAKPFCLMVSYGPPHNPYKAPTKHLGKYKGVSIPKRPNVPKKKGRAGSELKHYYAMITSLDECMGRIAKALDEAGISKDTILCFSSDHGDMMGSQGHVRKQRPWEESINIPFIMRYPRRIKAAQKKDWLFSSVDVMPTLLGLCGAPIPKQVQGMNLSATFTGKSKQERDAAFLFNALHGNGPGTAWRGIRTKEWVYAYHARGDWVMYDLKRDPYELKNLVKDPASRGQRDKLRAQLDAMRNELGEKRVLKGKVPAPERVR